RVAGLQSLRQDLARIAVENLDIPFTLQFRFRGGGVFRLSIVFDADDSRVGKTARENERAFAASAAGFENLLWRKRVYRCIKQEHLALANSAEAGFGQNASNYFSILR